MNHKMIRKWPLPTVLAAFFSFITPNAHGQAAKPPAPEDAAPASPMPLQRRVETLSTDELVEKYHLPTITPGAEVSLAEALKTANDRNLDLKAMQAEIAIAQGRLKTAWGAILPVIQGKMSYTVHDHEDAMRLPDSEGNVIEIVTNRQHNVQGGIEAYMPIIDPKAWWGVKVAKEASALTQMNVETVRQQVLLNVAEAYFSSLMAAKLIEIHLSTLVAFDYSRNIAESRHKVGAGLRIDVIRAETDIETARQQLIAANLFYDNTRDVLAILTDTEGLPLPVDPGPVAVPEEETEVLEQKAMENRPDLKAAREQVAFYNIQIQESYMQFLPYLTASWSGSYQFTEPSDAGPDDRSRMAGVFSLVVPIYDHYRYGDVDTKRASLRKTEFEIRNAERNATMAVRKARRDYLAALASAEAAKKQSLLSKEALTLTEASYNTGTGSSLEVTDARRTALQADVNATNQELEAQIALLGLIYAIGEDMRNLGK